MKSFLASARSLSGLDRVDRDVRLLEEEWQRHGDVAFERFWQRLRDPGTEDRDSELTRLGTLIKTDLRCRFERGQIPAVAEYLDRFPDLREADSRVISLIYEEFCLLEEQGRSPDAEAFCDRYPAWKDSLASQLRYHHILSRAAGLRPATPHFPEPGEQFEEYELVALIGRGGSSRVFLARDLSLGGKRVVLKVSLDKGQEPKTQGALDHPHIVPVNSVVFQLDRGLRGLSMPLRQGLPLDEIIRRVRPADRPRPAITLWEAMVKGSSAGTLPLSTEERDRLLRAGPRGDGWNGFPVRGDYAQGVAWIGMVLARALHYAHGMQTFHRDVKPGNVLITLHHGPQLLDFNLAESPHAAQHAESAMLGGTLPYMAPEQIEAFLNPDLWGKVGAKADLYSLGLVLRELLTGQPPDLPDDKLPPARSMRDLLDRRAVLPTDVRRYVPEIPCALDAIVQRCLAFDADQRYPDGQALADDLQRFLNREPLQYVNNPSSRERLVNWTARNGRSLAGMALLLAAGMMIGFLASPTISARLRSPIESRPLLAEAKRDVEEGRYDDAISKLEKLEREYPTHFIPKMYLGIAHSGIADLSENPGHLYYREAMSSPGAKETLRAWARKDPKAAEYLARMGVTWLNHLQVNSSFKNATAAALPGDTSSQPSSEKMKRSYAEAIVEVLELALELDPEQVDLRVGIATAEEILGNYETAYAQLTELIDGACSAEDFSRMDDLTNWYIQRARVAVHMAPSLCGRGDQGGCGRALTLLRNAAVDLQRCSGTTTSSLAPAPGSALRANQTRLFYLYIRTEVLLTLGELELSRGLWPQAERNFGSARKTLGDLVDYYNASGTPIAQSVQDELRNRVREGLDRAKQGALLESGTGTAPSTAFRNAP